MKFIKLFISVVLIGATTAFGQPGGFTYYYGFEENRPTFEITPTNGFTRSGTAPLTGSFSGLFSGNALANTSVITIRTDFWENSPMCPYSWLFGFHFQFEGLASNVNWEATIYYENETRTEKKIVARRTGQGNYTTELNSVGFFPGDLSNSPNPPYFIEHFCWENNVGKVRPVVEFIILNGTASSTRRLKVDNFFYNQTVLPLHQSGFTDGTNSYSRPIMKIGNAVTGTSGNTVTGTVYVEKFAQGICSTSCVTFPGQILYTVEYLKTKKNRATGEEVEITGHSINIPASYSASITNIGTGLTLQDADYDYVYSIVKMDYYELASIPGYQLYYSPLRISQAKYSGLDAESAEVTSDAYIINGANISIETVLYTVPWLNDAYRVMPGIGPNPNNNPINPSGSDEKEPVDFFEDQVEYQWYKIEYLGATYIIKVDNSGSIVTIL